MELVKNSGLTLYLKKANFARSEVKFCGFIVGSGKRKIDPEKLEAIRDLKRPETKTQLRQVLGLFNFFRDFIPNFAEQALPLTGLTSKRVPMKIPWNTEQECAFSSLKSSLIQAVDRPLHIIDWERPFNIFSDASDYAVAAALTQTDDQGRELPIAFYSKRLTETQRNWATIEKEAYAVLEALRLFQTWVFGCKINVYSDHNPLSFLTTSATRSAKLLRWSLALQEFDVNFCYKSGKSPAMAVPDCLSRIV